MESRLTLLETPRVGARVQSFSAEVRIARKTSFRHQWVFDLDCARLLCVSSSVNLAFDIKARRSIEIPESIRAGLESQYHPDYSRTSNDEAGGDVRTRAEASARTGERRSRDRRARETALPSFAPTSRNRDRAG